MQCGCTNRTVTSDPAFRSLWRKAGRRSSVAWCAVASRSCPNGQPPPRHVTTTWVTASEMDVESLATGSDVVGLVEPDTSDPGPGRYAAESIAVPAGKDVWQTTVAV